MADFETVEALLASAKELGIEVHEGYEWSHDSFYAIGILDSGYFGDRKALDRRGVLIASQEASTVLTLSMARKCRGGVILASAGCHQHPEISATPSRW